MTYTTHIATENDADDILRLDKQFPGGNFYRNKDSFLRPNSTTIIAKDGDDTVGYIHLDHKDYGVHINKMLVDKAHRDFGVGGILLDHAKKVSPNVSLNVRHHNAHAIGLYQKHGFKLAEVKPSYYMNGDDAHHMVFGKLNESTIEQEEFERAKLAASHRGEDQKLKSDTTLVHVLKRAANAQLRGDMDRHNYWMKLAYRKLVAVPGM
jgi:ribosomal protein S18 acetylase RimI-like enzyme